MQTIKDVIEELAKEGDEPIVPEEVTSTPPYMSVRLPDPGRPPSEPRAYRRGQEVPRRVQERAAALLLKHEPDLSEELPQPARAQESTLPCGLTSSIDRAERQRPGWKRASRAKEVQGPAHDQVRRQQCEGICRARGNCKAGEMLNGIERRSARQSEPRGKPHRREGRLQTEDLRDLPGARGARRR
jgi:hypothetical protein